MAILVLIAVGTVAVTLWWRYRVRSDAEGFYRRLHEAEQKDAKPALPASDATYLRIRSPAR